MGLKSCMSPALQSCFWFWRQPSGSRWIVQSTEIKIQAKLAKGTLTCELSDQYDRQCLHGPWTYTQRKYGIRNWWVCRHVQIVMETVCRCLWMKRNGTWGQGKTAIEGRSRLLLDSNQYIDLNRSGTPGIHARSSFCCR